MQNCVAIPRGSNNASLLTNHVTDETRTGDNCYITPLRIQLDRVMVASGTFMQNSAYYPVGAKKHIINDDWRDIHYSVPPHSRGN